MKRLWFTRKKFEPATPATPPIPDGYLAPLSAEALLAAEHRQRLLARIWQYTALSPAQFQPLYMAPLQRYARYVQRLPASESHHHAYPGGMLDHGLELVACCLKLRQSYLLPSGAAPEDQAAQADAWSAGIAYGALLHDIGKLAVDLEVEGLDGQTWHPWQGPLEQPYRCRYRPGRDYHLHGAAAGLLYTRILDTPLLDWLSEYPPLWSALLYLLANHYERAGLLGELVLQADRISTAQNIGANPGKALQAPVHSLQHHLLMGLRHLVKHQFKLNQPGAAGWLTDQALWLVSKTATDQLRAYLLGQSVDGIPSSNIALFDELQSHGLVEATAANKAIWSATVTDGDWQQRFSFLRLQPALIWADEVRPEPFSGTVDVVSAEQQDSQSARPDVTMDTAAAPNTNTRHRCVASPVPVDPSAPASTTTSAADDTDYLSTLLDWIEPVAPPAAPEQESITTAPQPSKANIPRNLGEHFVNWLRAGLASHTLIINDSRAKVHTVNGTFFLVTPGIFQCYAQEHPPQPPSADDVEHWLSVQKAFEKLDLHQRSANGQNIWVCRVRGPRKTAELNGYLLSESTKIARKLPPNNPFLSLM